MTSLRITGPVSIAHMQPSSLVFHREAKPRTKLPIPVWNGQNFAALHKGMDSYSPTPSEDFARLADLSLNLYTLENAWFVVGNGLDGMIVDADGQIIREPSCFTNPDVLGPERDLMAAGLPVFELDDVFVGFDGAWHNYFHWLCFALARSHVADALVPPGCQIVIPDYEPRPGGFHANYTKTNYEQSLQASGLADRLTKLPMGLYRARTLRFMWHQPRQPTEFLEIPAFYEVFASMRKKLSRRPDAPRRLLLSRAAAPSPRIGMDAARLVHAMCEARGFREVRFEDMDFNAQAQALFDADCIVAPHGAGLVNTLFGRDSLKVLELGTELDNNGSIRACFYQLATNRGQPYMVLNGSQGEINTATMTAALDMLCGA